MASSSSIETAHLLATIEVPLFVIAAYLPTNRTCSQLAHTVGSVIRFHPEAHILLVDNDTPKPNLASALSYFHARRFSERLHISSRQFPSHGQLGSWLVAHALLRRARSASGAGLLASDIALRSVTRVAMLQHSTPLKYPLPPRPHKHCRVGSLASHKPRTFYIHPREYRKDGPNVILSTIASVLGIRCMAPCVDPKTGKPVEGGASSSQQRRAYKKELLEAVGAAPDGRRLASAAADEPQDWTMVPHAVLDFYEVDSFLSLGDALTSTERNGDGTSASLEMARLWSAVDEGRISLKEVNGELERFAGLVLAWLNNYDKRCERPKAARKVFVSKVRGFTFGGSWHSSKELPPEVEHCPARRDEAPPCFLAENDGCGPGHAWPPNMTRPVTRGESRHVFIR